MNKLTLSVMLSYDQIFVLFWRIAWIAGIVWVVCLWHSGSRRSHVVKKPVFFGGKNPPYVVRPQRAEERLPKEGLTWVRSKY